MSGSDRSLPPGPPDAPAPPAPPAPRVPEWVRTVTRPTPGEVDRMLGGLDPRLAQLARVATAPTSREVAAIRPRPRPYAGWAALVPASAAVLAAVLGLLSTEPTVLSGRVVQDDDALYVLTAGQELHLGAVEVRGVGTVREHDGVLRVAGALRLRVDDPVVIEVGGQQYHLHDALVQVDGPRVVVEPLVVEVAKVDPEPTQPVTRSDPAAPAPEDLGAAAPGASAGGGSVPADRGPADRAANDRASGDPSGDRAAGDRAAGDPAAEDPAAGDPAAGDPAAGDPAAADADPSDPAGVDPGDAAWREVLERLEAGGPAEARVEALEAFARAHPRSRFAAEAEALALRIRGADGDPAAALARIEAWLAAHPSGPRRLELEVLAARIARDGLRDCARARPHDEVVAEHGAAADRARARAFVGLCALSLGRTGEGSAWLHTVDLAALDPALREAVARAMEEP